MLIPEDPEFVPDPQRQRRAEDKLRAMAPQANEISSRTFAAVQCHDCGQNFERIACPHCGTGISIDWWGAAMDRDWEEAGFNLRSHDLPCCANAATLHDLKYYFPQGFGRYVLAAMNPDIGDLSRVQRQDLESVIGRELRVVLSHL